MQPLFMDESGDLGFGCGTDYFIVSYIAPEKGKKLNRVVKNFNAHLIRNGWNQAVEIKATNVWHAQKNADIPTSYAYKSTPEVPMKTILDAIAEVPGYIECAVFKLDTVPAGLQTVPCDILYNYFSWKLLEGPLCHFSEVELFKDRRNTESRHNIKFDGFIENNAGIARAEKAEPPLTLNIHHYHWGSANGFKGAARATVEYGVRGIEAADFVCWAIKRKYEDGDERWYSIIEPIVKFKRVYF